MIVDIERGTCGKKRQMMSTEALAARDKVPLVGPLQEGCTAASPLPFSVCSLVVLMFGLVTDCRQCGGAA